MIDDVYYGMLEDMTFDQKLGVRVYVGGWKPLCMM